VRDMYARAHPLCERCESAGKVVPMEVVHHISTISEGGERLAWDNLMSLCRSCHEAIHGPERFRKRV
jgi:5-methylcytosine-specific restriction protein A